MKLSKEQLLRMAETIGNNRPMVSDLLETLEEYRGLLEQAVEELEYCYGQKTELTERIRDVL